MTFNEYQAQARSTRLASADYHYLLLNLAAEVGELLSLEAKARRDEHDVDLYSVKKELGDILWHVAMIADANFLTLDRVAQMNLDKLADRQKRNVIGGSGDDR